jgi:hypothetical protein
MAVPHVGQLNLSLDPVGANPLSDSPSHRLMTTVANSLPRRLAP